MSDQRQAHRAPPPLHSMKGPRPPANTVMNNPMAQAIGATERDIRRAKTEIKGRDDWAYVRCDVLDDGMVVAGKKSEALRDDQRARLATLARQLFHRPGGEDGRAEVVFGEDAAGTLLAAVWMRDDPPDLKKSPPEFVRVEPKHAQERTIFESLPLEASDEPGRLTAGGIAHGPVSVKVLAFLLVLVAIIAIVALATR